MNKILLVYEDYADLMAIESTLKKVGFDVIGLTSEYSITEQILAFNPDLVVGSGNSGKVTSLGVGKRLKEMSRWAGKSILIFSQSAKPSAEDLMRIRVDMLLESPVPPLRLVQVIGKLLDLDESLLLERLNKAMHLEGAPSAGNISSISGNKNQTASESIFIQGGKGEDESDENIGILSGDGNSEDKESSRRGFRFGDRMQAYESEVISGGDAAPEVEFESVDLASLEQELFGTPPAKAVPAESLQESEKLKIQSEPEVPSSEAVVSSTVSEEELAEIALKAQQELFEAEAKLVEKREKYAQFANAVQIPAKSTITRVEARRRFRELQGEQSAENLKDLDGLRRQFTKALFKK